MSKARKVGTILKLALPVCLRKKKVLQTFPCVDDVGTLFLGENHGFLPACPTDQAPVQAHLRLALSPSTREQRVKIADSDICWQQRLGFTANT